MSRSQYKNQRMKIEIYQCVKCRDFESIPRKITEVREYGHKKHMYCKKCSAITLHINRGDRVWRMTKFM